MTVVDSCGWLEIFTDGPLAGRYEPYFKRLESLVTPSVVIYEVYKVVRRERGESVAILAVAQLNQTRIVELNADLAISAADLSLKCSLPMADAIIYATAIQEQCEVVTSDRHFAELCSVVYIIDPS